MAFRNQPHRIKGIIPQGGHPAVFFLVFFLTTLAPVWAQTVSYYTELHFIQRLAWIGDEYAMRYEVLIEKEEEGEYNRVLREFTDAFFIDVSLPPGKYRCQIIPYDYLDQPVPASEWMNFEVRPGKEKLLIGEHEIIIVNPGDETGQTETIILAVPGAEPSERAETEENTENQINLYVEAAWMPFLFLSAGNLTPGAGVRLGIVSAKQNFLSVGMEFTASWCIYDIYEVGTGYQTVQSLTFDFNFLVQTHFSGGRAALNFRLGTGFSFPFSIRSDYIEDAHVNFGISFHRLLLKNFYVETGIDYSQFLTKTGFLRPWIGLGLRS